MPIGAIAAAIGAGISGLGLVGARRNQQRTGRAIGQAYTRADRRLVQRQGDIRQGTNESLIARGLVTGGQESTPAAAKSTDWTTLMGGKPFNLGSYTKAAQRADENRTDNFGPQSQAGQIGERNTLAGSIGTRLGKEFTLERQDLNAAQDEAKRANNAEFLSNAMGAIAGGVQSGLGLYNAFTQPRPGTTAGGAAGANAGVNAGGLRGAFGIDPADPLSSFGTETRVADFKVRPRSS